MEDEIKADKPTEQINFVGVGITLLILFVIAFAFDMDKIQEWIKTAGIWAPFIFILLKVSTIVIAPLSGSPLYPLVGLLFGFWPGILYVALGDFIGYTISFYISRIFGQKVVNKLISGKEEGLLARIVDHISDTKGFLHACMTLFAMPELLSYGAGLSRLPYLKFISILMPLSAFAASILVFFGSLLEPEGKSILLSLGVPIFFGLVILTGGTLFLKAVKKKNSGDPTGI